MEEKEILIEKEKDNINDINNNDNKKRKYEVVISIDFGSSGMGYAYSFNDPEKIELGRIYGAGADSKVPCEVIIDSNFQVLAFGEKCKTFISQNSQKDDYYYFKNIKMNLYKKNKLKIKAENSEREFNLSQIISKILLSLRDEALKQIHHNRPDLDNEKIKWIITVPAIWDESAKIIMVDAAIDAKILENTTDLSCFFALEPEAASLYCLNDGGLDNNFMVKGREYIVCDLGGGTADIVAHVIGNDIDSVAELAPPSGGNFGGNEIDHYFFQNIIGKIFGVTNFSELNKKNKENNEPYEMNDLYNEWIEIERQVRLFKESLTQEEIDKNATYSIKFSVFKELMTEDDFKEKIEQFNSTTKEGWKIIVKKPKRMYIDFPYKIIYDLIDNQSLKISVEIKNILNRSKNIQDIIFVGSYCNNDIIVKLIKEKIDSPDIRTYKPSSPGLAILKGAVIFGIKPFIIQKRKARYTIGQASNNIWNESKHRGKGKKVYDEEKLIWRCEDCFDVYLKVDSDVFFNETIVRKYRMCGPRYTNLRFLKTTKSDPIFAFEDGVTELKRCILDAGKDYPFGERDFQVTMTVGGTFIDVKAVHIKSGNNIHVEFKTDVFK